MSIILYELVGSDATKPFSPHCWKARLALEHKAVNYTTVPVSFLQIPDIENGGQKTVPVIRHGERIISDSFNIATYLRENYPDKGRRLFVGDGSEGLTRFVESWTQTQLHSRFGKYAMLDIHNMLSAEDQAYFRESREKRFGMTLEQFVADREKAVPAMLDAMTPLRHLLTNQDFIGGSIPIFADYIAFGAFQWLRVCSGLHMIPKDDKVMEWVNRILDLYDGMARAVPEAVKKSDL